MNSVFDMKDGFQFSSISCACCSSVNSVENQGNFKIKRPNKTIFEKLVWPFTPMQKITVVNNEKPIKQKQKSR